MPTFSKVSHTSFSVPDAERSIAWYGKVLGFEPLEEVSGEGWHGMVLVHPATGTVIEFQQHDESSGDEFDPRRTGLDHLAFKLDTREALDEWMDHLHHHEVVHSPISDREYGSVLPFKDADGIQLEVFYRENHP